MVETLLIEIPSLEFVPLPPCPVTLTSPFTDEMVELVNRDTPRFVDPPEPAVPLTVIGPDPVLETVALLMISTPWWKSPVPLWPVPVIEIAPPWPVT